MPSISPYPWVIYALKEPSGAVRYVGFTTNLKIRLTRHLAQTAYKSTPVSVWIGALQSAGSVPLVEILQSGLPGEDYGVAERHWVELMSASGAALLNVKTAGLPSPINPPNVCEQCGLAFWPYRKVLRFCSRKCYFISCPQRLLILSAERFWQRVDKTETCWLYRGPGRGKGYGGFGRGRLAHRYSWELHFGTIPKWLEVLHHCDVRRCVRPDHLFLGTSGENNKDTVRKGRNARWDKMPHAKISDEQVCEIRSRSHEMKTDLAKEYGVSASLIHMILTGERRRNPEMVARGVGEILANSEVAFSGLHGGVSQ